MGIEQRASKRIPLSVVVKYRVNSQERVGTYRVQSVNIGERGIFLKTDLPLGIGTEVQLEFTLPETNEKLRFKGKVVWSGSVKEDGKEPVAGKGINFTGCDDRCRRQLMEYIRGSGG